MIRNVFLSPLSIKLAWCLLCCITNKMIWSDHLLYKSCFFLYLKGEEKAFYTFCNTLIIKKIVCDSIKSLIKLSRTQHQIRAGNKIKELFFPFFQAVHSRSKHLLLSPWKVLWNRTHSWTSWLGQQHYWDRRPCHSSASFFKACVWAPFRSGMIKLS